MGTDLQQERAARNQALFRMVNEHIEEVNRHLGADDEVREYVCECLDTSCADRLSIPHGEYQRIRRNPAQFVLAPGHEQPQVEEVVDRTDHWVVVRKLGAGAKVAIELAHQQALG
jgi:hypothetical protein